MWLRFIAFLAPFSRYLMIIGLLGAVAFGGWTMRNYYVAKIKSTELAYNQRLFRYNEQLINLDKEYVTKLKKVQGELVITQRKLHEEVTKPEYSCPIPDAGIKLLNDAIGASKTTGDNK